MVGLTHKAFAKGASQDRPYASSNSICLFWEEVTKELAGT